jgi:hypothetical protein
MKKCKVFIDWEYKLEPLPYHNWIGSDIDNADLIISVNRINNFKKTCKKVLWLLEPRDIEPELYKTVEKIKIDYDAIISHCDNLKTKNHIFKIDPCIPSWIDAGDQKIYPKSKNISMIASVKIMCEGHKYRQEIANKVYSIVDLFGRGRKKSVDSKIYALKDYRFSIAMENSCADTYFTEKILDCFLTGTIPIYWGTKKVFDIFDKYGIIWLEDFMLVKNSFNFEQEYENRKNSVLKNLEIAKSLNFNSMDGIHKIVERVLD